MSRPAVFLDRDGTLVEPRHYPASPAELRLYPEVASPLRRLQEMGFLLIVVTNQSGVARGLFTEDALAEMHAHLRSELGASGVRLAGIYYCAHHPEGVVPRLAIRCDCRKPEPGMLLRAGRDFDIDLARSWLVGDILDDVEAGKRAGCRTILVDLGTERYDPNPLRRPDFVCRESREALELILESETESMDSIAGLAFGGLRARTA